MQCLHDVHERSGRYLFRSDVPLIGESCVPMRGNLDGDQHGFLLSFLLVQLVIDIFHALDERITARCLFVGERIYLRKHMVPQFVPKACSCVNIGRIRHEGESGMTAYLEHFLFRKS